MKCDVAQPRRHEQSPAGTSDCSLVRGNTVELHPPLLSGCETGPYDQDEEYPEERVTVNTVLRKRFALLGIIREATES
ncbi:MAG TPA: hypothetical protein VFA41_11515 [Ktedonobacteraceae bacterium]|jgi:hypothetical protein|nr:hypothetical protein [Ktedonobacteraceae bacterium]